MVIIDEDLNIPEWSWRHDFRVLFRLLLILSIGRIDYSF